MSRETARVMSIRTSTHRKRDGEKKVEEAAIILGPLRHLCAAAGGQSRAGLCRGAGVRTAEEEKEEEGKEEETRGGSGG